MARGRSLWAVMVCLCTLLFYVPVVETGPMGMKGPFDSSSVDSFLMRAKITGQALARVAKCVGHVISDAEKGTARFINTITDHLVEKPDWCDEASGQQAMNGARPATTTPKTTTPTICVYYGFSS